ncbi:TRAP transporter small permease [Tritonibacter horizontis]|uniref:TRAP transporter small permease protein n=1 Tax=Tritonibacter horizontis TaxID=1768241 RepID=A0A132BY32_9RHOB|nr:TRAP transporter small permease subunit [Tritonibacter horizontis]KUP92640.1 2,3-diketo-L-gulonate TRAP transporter small permease protein YiaM [Tritonibacter horizontis]
MHSLNRLVERILAGLSGLSIALVFSIIFVNALRRYTLGKSLPWGEELPIYLTIYGVMFGVALAYMQDRHIRFTVLTEFLSERVRARLWLLVDGITALSGLGLMFAGHAFAVRRGNLDSSGLKSAAGWLSDTTGFETLLWIGKTGTWQYAMPIGGALLCLAATLKFAERLSALRSA